MVLELFSITQRFLPHKVRFVGKFSLNSSPENLTRILASAEISVAPISVTISLTPISMA